MTTPSTPTGDCVDADRYGAFERDILVVLAGHGPCTGATVGRALSTYYDTPIAGSRLYVALNRLVEKDAVAKRDHDDDARAKRYDLTQEGRAFVAGHVDWIRTHAPPMTIADLD